MPFQTQVNNNKNNWFYPSNHIYVFFIVIKFISNLII
jgi:hypothetical protein